jgi:predicted 3-demethylubiquinone-9 3-methyltransferase (glyoxalase superfamily)
MAGGGKASQCGWLKDRFGLSWQIVPKVLPELIGGPDPQKATRATQAMLKMGKLDISELQRAYDGV